MRKLLPLLLFLLITGCDEEFGLIVVRNETGTSITSVTVDPCGSTGPSSNVLGDGSIQSGNSEAFRVEYGCYDVRVLTANGLTGQWKVRIGSGGRRVDLFAQAP